MMKPEATKRLQIMLTALFVLVSGGFAVHGVLNLPPDDIQRIVNFHYHPIASIAGALTPTIILMPFVYWMFGRICRRIAGRFKVCEHCAETIKSEAKVCRYCGRDVEWAEPVSIAQPAILQPMVRKTFIARLGHLLFAMD